MVSKVSVFGVEEVVDENWSVGWMGWPFPFVYLGRGENLHLKGVGFCGVESAIHRTDTCSISIPIWLATNRYYWMDSIKRKWDMSMNLDKLIEQYIFYATIVRHGRFNSIQLLCSRIGSSACNSCEIYCLIAQYNFIHQISDEHLD